MRRGLSDGFIINEISSGRRRSAFDTTNGKKSQKNKSIAQQKLVTKSRGIEKSIKNLQTLKQLMSPQTGGAYQGKSPNTHTLSRTG